MLCYAMLCYAMLCYTILYYTILYYTMLYYTILYYTILYYTILYYTILYYTILYYTILYYTILYYTILCYTIRYDTIRHETIPYHTILYHTILAPVARTEVSPQQAASKLCWSTKSAPVAMVGTGASHVLSYVFVVCWRHGVQGLNLFFTRSVQRVAQIDAERQLQERPTNGILPTHGPDATALHPGVRSPHVVAGSLQDQGSFVGKFLQQRCRYKVHEVCRQSRLGRANTDT